MKRHGVRLITAALATAVAAACFSDPTSSLRDGPSSIVLSRSAAIVPIGDSTLVEARVVDRQGNVLPATGAAWTTDNAAVADVDVAATQVPAEASSRAYIKGIATLGGITTVRVTVRGLTDSVRVTALPTQYLGTGTFAVTGTATADTTPLGAAFTAGDTITITAPAGMTFDAAASVITLGGTGTYLLSRSASAVKALVIKGYRGQATVTNVTWLGNATTGDYSVGSLNTTDTVTVARGRFRGGAAVSTGVFGTNTLLTLTAQTGTTFNTTGSTTGVVFGTNPGIVVSRTASTVTAITPLASTDVVKVTNVNIGTVRVDSLFTPGGVTIAASNFPGTVTQLGTGRLLDTILVIGGPDADFTTTGTSASNVTVNGATAFVLRRASDTLYVISKLGGTSTVSVSNVVVAGPTTITSLTTAGTTTVSTATTGEANEPANDAPGAVTIDFSTATSANPLVIYGAVDDGAADVDDFFSFTLASAKTVTIRIEFAGTGGGGATTPDVDLLVCNAACSAWAPGGTAGATAAQPENIVLTNLAAGTYNILVEGWDTGGTTVAYKLIVY